MDALEIVRRREASARVAVQAAADDSSLCALSRSGRSYPAVKYHEGAASVLAELRRMLAKGADRTAVEDSATALGDTWRERARGRLVGSVEWQAYFAGGVEALDELVTDLNRES